MARERAQGSLHPHTQPPWIIIFVIIIIIRYCATGDCIRTVHPSTHPYIKPGETNPTRNKTKQNRPQTKMTDLTSQNIKDILRANAEHVQNFPPPGANLQPPPSRQLLIGIASFPSPTFQLKLIMGTQ